MTTRDTPEAAHSIIVALDDDRVRLTAKLDAIGRSLANEDLAEIASLHRMIGPSHDSSDGLGSCSCGDDDCEVATVLNTIGEIRDVLARRPA